MSTTTPIITQHTKGNRRYYTVAGDSAVPEDAQLASVTTILNVVARPALIPWARNQSLQKIRETLLDWMDAAANDSGAMMVLSQEVIDALIEEARNRPDAVRDAAADMGTQAHAAIEKYLKGEPPDIDEWPEQVRQAVANFLAWYRDTDIQLVISEQMVYSAKYLYAGTMDAYGTREPGDHIVVDFKTGGIHPEAALQVAAYAKAWEEMTGQPVSRGIIVSVKRDTAEFEVKEVADLGASFQAFLAAKVLHEGTKASAFKGRG